MGLVSFTFRPRYMASSEVQAEVVHYGWAKFPGQPRKRVAHVTEGLYPWQFLAAKWPNLVSPNKLHPLAQTPCAVKSQTRPGSRISTALVRSFLIHKLIFFIRKPRVHSIEASCFDECILLTSMFSVKYFMEEGFKFIIPPPKYHPYPNLLPVLEPSFLQEKMAADTPYHHLPEEPDRPSIETIPGDDQPLLDPLYDDDSPPPPKKRIFKFKFSYHPTFHLRLAVLCLSICAFSVFIASRHSNAIPSIIFLAFAILRNVVVLYYHLVGHSLIRIRIEIVGRTASGSNAKPKKWRPSWFPQRLVQVAIDWILIGVLIATTITGKHAELYYYYWDRDTFVLPACVLTWIAL